MQKINNSLNIIKKVLNKNSPAILTGLAISGTITTAYLTGKASYKAGQILYEYSEEMPPKEKLEMIWKLYIPSAISGVATIGCIISATKISSKRAAAAYSILSVSEKAFEEYREKVVEKLGEKKEKEIHDEAVQERITKSPPNTTIIAEEGKVLCCELLTGRYFNSDMQTLRKAQNDINAQIISDAYVCLNDFYYIVGLPYTSNSGNYGWTSEKLLDLEFTTVLSEDSKPCIAFDYNYVDII